MYDVEVIVLGGGLAGLTASIDLAQKGHDVLLIEKNEYPNHKVCGEYVSNEVKPYLNALGIEISSKSPVSIDTLLLSTTSGNTIKTKLPLGGFGLSRYAFDALLFEAAQKNGVEFRFDTFEQVRFDNNRFMVKLQSGKEIQAKQVIGAFGKRSSLDMALRRKFTTKKAPWLGIKCHYEFKGCPDNQVALHNFPGGYGGLSKTEEGLVNFCYLTSYKSFKKERNIEDFNANVVSRNPYLKDFLQNAVPKFKNPMAIAQISFDGKKAVENHIPMLGDAAGMIHPLCGNGMAMAIHSAKLAADTYSPFLLGRYDREEVEISYEKKWKRQFSQRMWMGRRLQSLLLNKTLAEWGIETLARSETVLKTLIARTHGKPILS